MRLWRIERLFVATVLMSIVLTVSGTLFASGDSDVGGVLYCQRNHVNVRVAASVGSKILVSLAVNDSIVVLEEQGDWYRTDYKSGEGWVSRAFFAKTKVRTASYWYNSKSDVLHNSGCRWYGVTKNGYYTNEALGRDCRICGGVGRVAEPIIEESSSYRYWINSKSGVRHNSGCRWFGNTTHGYYTQERVGRACGICGG